MSAEAVTIHRTSCWTCLEGRHEECIGLAQSWFVPGAGPLIITCQCDCDPIAESTPSPSQDQS